MDARSGVGVADGPGVLVPGLRRALARWILVKMHASGSIHVSTFRSGPGPGGGGRRGPGEGPVIEGDYAPVDEDTERSGAKPGSRPAGKTDGRSPWST